MDNATKTNGLYYYDIYIDVTERSGMELFDLVTERDMIIRKAMLANSSKEK